MTDKQLDNKLKKIRDKAQNTVLKSYDSFSGTKILIKGLNDIRNDIETLRRDLSA